MSIVYDVIIIGSGVVGSSIARELSRYRLKIAVLEKEEELSFGVSKSNSGIIHPGTQNPPGLLKTKLCVQGNTLTRAISEELGVDFRQTGQLVVAFSDDDAARLRKMMDEGSALGVPGLKIVDRIWLRENEPNLNPAAASALYAPTAGIISPYRLVYGLCENAIRNGVMINTCTKVTSISRSGSHFEANTSKGVFRSRFIVNAAGLYADEVSAMAGIRDFKITPRKGEEFILDKKRADITRHLIFPIPSKTSKGVLVIKTADGNPMIGPTARDIDDKEDRSTTAEGLKSVFDSARRLVPALREDDIIAYFAGLRPVAGDDFIIRHEDGAPGFVNVAGIQSPGLTAAPAIAVMVSAILKDHGLTMKKKLFFVKRRRKSVHLFPIPLSETEKLIKKDKDYGDIVCRCEMVSYKEIKDAISRGAKTLDGIKFRTRAQAGRCHGSFCTTRLMKILAREKGAGIKDITKRGHGSEIVKGDRRDG